MAMGGETDQGQEATASALLRRWTVLRERCMSELHGGDGVADRESLQHLRQKLDALEKEVIVYEKEQHTSYWFRKSSRKMLLDMRETIGVFRSQLDMFSSYQHQGEQSGGITLSINNAAQSFDILDENSFLMEYSYADELKVDTNAQDPWSRYHSIRMMRETLQGTILFGIDAESGEHVALKLSSKSAVLKQESLNGDKVLEDPINEMRLLEQLSLPGHRHLIRLVGSLEDDKNYWMVLEFASGGELFDLVYESGKLDEGSASRLFLQLARALEYIHSQNICHLDLSLENILLSENGDVKLTDFGLARQFEQLKPFPGCAMTKPGKIGYMSPEIFAGRDFVGPQADMYSAGVVLFVMLFGCPPYEIPAPSDRRFRLVFFGEVRELVHKWQMAASPLALDLLSGLLCRADERLSIQEVLDHPWLSNCDVDGS